MTDDILRDLVTKHDKVIDSLIMSVDHLVGAQSRTNEQQIETNKRLEEISKYLAKQMVFDSKLQSMDKDLSDSFRRVHLRIDTLNDVQSSDSGCNSVRLLRKDVESITKDISRLIESVRGGHQELNNLDTVVKSFISPTTAKWVIGVALTYGILFGTYVVQSIHSLNSTQVKLSTMREK